MPLFAPFFRQLSGMTLESIRLLPDLALLELGSLPERQVTAVVFQNSKPGFVTTGSVTRFRVHSCGGGDCKS